MGAFDTVKLKSVIKLLKRYGYEMQRQSGSHMTFSKPGIPQIITIAKHGKEIKAYSAKDVMIALQLTPKAFLDKLKKL